MRTSIRQLAVAGVLALLMIPVTAAPSFGRATGEPVLSVRGTGPYRIGVTLDRLTAAGLVTDVWSYPGCDDVVDSGATGEWAGVILLRFRAGRLAEIGTATVPPRSPAGAAVGMSFAELEEVYGQHGELIRSDDGRTGYLVRIGQRVELFTDHPIRPGVGYFQVGPAHFVERTFRTGAAC
ncbi:hypothetical protein V6U90_10070 [Micromonospora sp. CPCC 206060]|uniref:hypothetical protein n=1 Tax=Micromonospora sp. CPCC 206060 TaxID=3122406 RepID=UPI002FF2E149